MRRLRDYFDLHFNYIAEELGLKIPSLIAIKDYKKFSDEKILVDDAEYVLQHLLGKIECMSISQEL